MQVAVFADTHIVSDLPQRLSVLQWTLSDIRERGVKVVVIAGDLCESAPFPYEIIRNLFLEFTDLKVYIVLGNHDKKGAIFSERYLALSNIVVVDSPYMLSICSRPILLLPYEDDISMAQRLFSLSDKYGLKQGGWILISHGDLIYGDVFNEDKGYFPITPYELRIFNPDLTILGHIHTTVDYPELNAYYCGSLIPINSSEMGMRRYALLDVERSQLSWIPVERGNLYWKDDLFIYDTGSLDTILSNYWQHLNNKFEQRRNWESDLELSLKLCILEDYPNLELKVRDWFRGKGVNNIKLEAKFLDLPASHLELIDSFIKRVEFLCSQEKDIIAWGEYKQDIVNKGLALLQNRLYST